MNRQMWVVAFVTVAFTSATLAAQTAGTSGSREQSPSGSVTLTGCLQKGTSGSGSTAGTAGTSTSSTPSSSSSSGGQFILTNAQMGSGSSSRSSTSGTSGTSTSGTTAGGTTSGASSSSSRYILDGQESELSKHVGEKVEISGTLERSTSSSSTSGTSGTSSTTGAGASSSSMGGQHVRVSSVKTISSSCSQ